MVAQHGRKRLHRKERLSAVCQDKHFQQWQRPLSLLLPTDPLTLITVGIPGPFPRTKDGSQFVVIITDSFLKLLRAVPASTTSTWYVATFIVDN